MNLKIGGLYTMRRMGAMPTRINVFNCSTGKATATLDAVVTATFVGHIDTPDGLCPTFLLAGDSLLFNPITIGDVNISVDLMSDDIISYCPLNTAVCTCGEKHWRLNKTKPGLL
jgi:hypothetical protein